MQRHGDVKARRLGAWREVAGGLHVTTHLLCHVGSLDSVLRTWGTTEGLQQGRDMVRFVLLTHGAGCMYRCMWRIYMKI